MSKSSKYFLPLSYAQPNRRNDKVDHPPRSVATQQQGSESSGKSVAAAASSMLRAELTNSSAEDANILQQLHQLISDSPSSLMFPSDTVMRADLADSDNSCISAGSGEIEEDDLIPFQSIRPSRTVATTLTVTTKIRKRKRVPVPCATLQLRSSESATSSSVLVPSSHSRKRSAIAEIRMMQKMEQREQRTQALANITVSNPVAHSSKLPPLLPAIDWTTIKETQSQAKVNEPASTPMIEAKVDSTPIQVISVAASSASSGAHIDLTLEDLDEIRHWKVIDDVTYPLDDESVEILHKSDRYVFSRMTAHQQQLYRQLQHQMEQRILAAQPMRKYLAPMPPASIAAEQRQREEVEASKEVQMEMMTSSKPLSQLLPKSTARSARSTTKRRVNQKKLTPAKRKTVNRSNKKAKAVKLTNKTKRVKSSILLSPSPSPSPSVLPILSPIHRARPPQRKAAAAVRFTAPDIEWEELGDTESEEEIDDDEYQPAAAAEAGVDSDEDRDLTSGSRIVLAHHQLTVAQAQVNTDPRREAHTDSIVLAYHSTNSQSRPPEGWLSQVEALIQTIRNRVTQGKRQSK